MIVIAMCISVLSGCADVRNMQITDCRVLSVSPRGLASVDADLSLEIFNPGPDMTVSDTEFRLREDGRDIMKITAAPLTVQGNYKGRYQVSCNASLQGGLSLFDIKNLLSGGDFSKYYVDISLYAGKGEGKGNPVKINRIPLSKLIGK